MEIPTTPNPILVVAHEGWSTGATVSNFNDFDKPVADPDGVLSITHRLDPERQVTFQYYALDTDLAGLLHFIERNGGIAAIVYPPHEDACNGPTLVFPDTEPGFVTVQGAGGIWEPAHWRTKRNPQDQPLPPGPCAPTI